MDRKTQNDDKVLYIDYINYDIHISPPEGEIFICCISVSAKCYNLVSLSGIFPCYDCLCISTKS